MTTGKWMVICNGIVLLRLDPLPHFCCSAAFFQRLMQNGSVHSTMVTILP
jgi:hypothetical protein